MKNLWTRAWIGLCLCLGAAQAQPAAREVDVRQLWQLIDYVAVDYGGAVSQGRVVSEGEYAEMREFTQNAEEQSHALPLSSSQQAIAAAVADLRAAVDRKADGPEVARLAQIANGLLLSAYPIPVAPKVLPDLAHGQKLYAKTCASCHGAAGNGDGPGAATLDPKPIAFTDPKRARTRSLMALYQAVSQGVSGTSMPGFAASSEEDRWALAFYVGTLSQDDSMRARGQQLWQTDRSLKALFPDMAAVTMTTEEAAARATSADTARAITAYLRSHPTAIEAGEPSGLALARRRLKESLEALHAGNRVVAAQMALSSYLDGFEPSEPVLGARNKSLLTAVEDAMLNYRSAVSAGSPERADAIAKQLDQLFARVESQLGAAATDPATTFLGAMTILLREGVEALLIVIGMIAFLKKAQRPDALRPVHIGWISALILGGATWAVATYLIALSGASREVTEGVGSVFAAAVLLGVGLWMHQKSSAGRWQAYLREKMTTAMSRRSAWALFALSFIAVYREVFETVLFYSALAADGNGGALLAGFASAALLLALIARVLLRTSARMQIGKFFSITSVLVAILAVILIGKGVAGLQEAGWIGVYPISGPRIEVLGLIPTAETVVAQIIVLIIALGGFGMNILGARKR
ncbi:MAG TPA: cytochrome c/FTR1 family iron permease [Steroidobacteraceae bacterium]|nr:cytochrome c/FTR1 family iron permease [Steroidobacteraceae bacterium]